MWFNCTNIKWNYNIVLERKGGRMAKRFPGEGRYEEGGCKVVLVLGRA